MSERTKSMEEFRNTALSQINYLREATQALASKDQEKVKALAESWKIHLTEHEAKELVKLYDPSNSISVSNKSWKKSPPAADPCCSELLDPLRGPSPARGRVRGRNIRCSAE